MSVSSARRAGTGTVLPPPSLVVWLTETADALGGMEPLSREIKRPRATIVRAAAGNAMRSSTLRDLIEQCTRAGFVLAPNDRVRSITSQPPPPAAA